MSSAEPEGEPVIRLRNISKDFPGVLAVDEVSSLVTAFAFDPETNLEAERIAEPCDRLRGVVVEEGGRDARQSFGWFLHHRSLGYRCDAATVRRAEV